LNRQKAARLETKKAQSIGKVGFRGLYDSSKLYFLITFAAVYGLVFINYIDIACSGSNYGYHLWLIAMYFLPFVGFSLFNLKNWQLTVSLGLITSLMNDVFYNIIRYLIGMPINLPRYYSLWFIPQNVALFHLNLGFADIQVMSWMMALSIYARIACVIGLLWIWKRRQ
jgi:hypothetical protein